LFGKHAPDSGRNAQLGRFGVEETGDEAMRAAVADSHLLDGELRPPSP